MLTVAPVVPEASGTHAVAVAHPPPEIQTTTVPGAAVVTQESAAGSVGDSSYEFVGKRYTVLNKRLAPGETFLAERGSMMHMSDRVTMRAFFGGVAGVAHGVLSGEALARVMFRNTGAEFGYVGVTPNQPMAIIVPVDLNAVGGEINCKRGAYIAGPETVEAQVKILPARSCLACCCGGMPPLIQALRGAGTGFLAAGGTVVKKTLAPGEDLLVDTDSVVAFTTAVGYDVRRVGNCVTCCFGGEGCFNTVLTGPGDVYIQTMSYERLIKFLGPSGGGGGNNKKDKKDGGAPPTAARLER